MEYKLEMTHTIFICQITGTRVQLLPDGTWETPGAEAVNEVMVTQSAMTYIVRRQATVAQWVELWSIFVVCTGKKGYEGGGCKKDEWWWQEATESQLQATCTEAQEAKRMGRQKEEGMQWGPGDGRHRAGSQDAGLETSDAQVDEGPHVVDKMSNIVSGEAG